jgi:hypothetical protein
MREKLFTLNRTQREDIWRHLKQTDDRWVADQLHAVPLYPSRALSPLGGHHLTSTNALAVHITHPA